MARYNEGDRAYDSRRQRNEYENNRLFSGGRLAKIENFVRKKPKKAVTIAAIGVFGLVTALKSYYTIPSDSQAVLKTLGKYSGTEEKQGLNFKVPWVQTATKVPVTRVLTEEIGFRSKKIGPKTEYGELTPEQREEYLTLTGDLNIADIEFIVQYKIKDPVDYLFNIKEPRRVLRCVSLHVMKQIIGDGSIDEAISTGRRENEINAKKEEQRIMDSYKAGMEITQVKLQLTQPPTGVRKSFYEVEQAKQGKQEKINEAKQQYNKEIPKTIGQAKRMIEEAEGYAIEKVNNARGDVDRFTKRLEEYEKAPEITRKRLYLETLEKILPNLAEKTIIEQKGAEGGLLMKLDVGGTGK